MKRHTREKIVDFNAMQSADSYNNNIEYAMEALAALFAWQSQ